MEYLQIGSAPAEEECAQVGEPDYETQALAQCDAFIKLIVRHLGPPPEGVKLLTKGFSHDFGTYYEVCVRFDLMNETHVDYAFKVESEAPATWEG